LQAPAAVASNVVFHANSLYGDVKVLDVSTVRFLILDGVTHGAVDRATTEPTADYLYQLESLAVMRPTARKALVIGLGAGILPEIFHRHYGIKTDVVEIDAVVADAARTYFGFTPTGVVAVEDGRTFVEHSSESYDIVVLDAFASERAPFHLFTEEFFQRVKARMAPGGVFGVNIICNPEHPAWHSVYKTLAAVFPHVRAFSMAVAEGAVGNMILVASDADIPLPEIARVRAPLRPFVEAMTAHQVPPPSEAASAAAPLLTDDFNPIDHLFRGIMETWRKHILRDNRSVLLYED
jgi:spermidine synthase